MPRPSLDAPPPPVAPRDALARARASGSDGPGPDAADRAEPARPGPATSTRSVAAAAMVAALLFAVLRLLAQGGDVSAFVHAGDRFTDPGAAHDLTVEPGSSGYDGQFSYRLARAPLSTAERVDGVAFDRPVDRTARIGYPVLAWLASAGGQRSLVPWALVGVNVAAIGVVAAAGAVLARDAGRSAWLGLVVAAAPGLIVALSRDLTEAVAAAALAGALVLLRRRRLAATTVALTFGALTRETVLVLALAVVAAAVLAALPEHRWPHRLEAVRRRLVDRDPVPAWVGVVPLVAYGAWRAWLSLGWDAPVGHGGDDPVNGLTVPFLAPLRQVVTFVGDAGDPVALIQLVAFVLVVAAVVVVVLGAIDDGRRAAVAGDDDGGTADGVVAGHERVAVALAVALLVSLTTWDRAVVFLRYPTDVLVLGAAVVPAAGVALVRRSIQVAVPTGLVAAGLWLAIA